MSDELTYKVQVRGVHKKTNARAQYTFIVPACLLATEAERRVAQRYDFTGMNMVEYTVTPVEPTDVMLVTYAGPVPLRKR